MPKFDIWTEGYLEVGATGLEAHPNKENSEPIEASTFNGAIETHVSSLPNEEAKNWIQDKGRWSMGGLTAHPDQESAAGITA